MEKLRSNDYETTGDEKSEDLDITETESSPTNADKGAKRRDAFENFEKEVLGRVENVAIARHELENIVRENPDISADDLKFGFDSKTNKLGLLPEQVVVAHSCIDRYISLHAAVKRWSERFPDSKDLFKNIYSREPKGKVEVRIGPMTIYFICYNIEDYTTIYTGDKNVNNKDIQIARRSGGVSTDSCPAYTLEGAIIAENCSEHSRPIKEILIHEEQHAIHRLFEKPLTGARYDYDFEREIDPEKRRLLFLQYFRYRREEIGEHDVTDEILAFKKGGRKNKEIIGFLMQKTEKGGLYGYFDKVKKELAKLYAHIPDIDDMIHEVFVVEYKKIVTAALTAFDNLRLYTDLDVDGEIAYFSMIPIRHWPKMVKRRRKLLTLKQFNEKVMVRENPYWINYECVAEEFDRMGEARHKQKNKKKRNG